MPALVGSQYIMLLEQETGVGSPRKRGKEKSFGGSKDLNLDASPKSDDIVVDIGQSFFPNTATCISAQWIITPSLLLLFILFCTGATFPSNTNTREAFVI